MTCPSHAAPQHWFCEGGALLGMGQGPGSVSQVFVAGLLAVAALPTRGCTGKMGLLYPLPLGRRERGEGEEREERIKDEGNREGRREKKRDLGQETDKNLVRAGGKETQGERHAHGDRGRESRRGEGDGEGDL